ncbi:MAG: gamma-glutamyl-gamma-aminobutyrate hydrolase family protein [Bacteroidales bacterium]
MIIKSHLPALLIAFIVLLTASCSLTPKQPDPVRLAISKAIPQDKYINYVNWIHFADTSIVCVDMYGHGIDSALAILETCDGLLLTGGEDINPDLYNRVFDSLRCDTPNDYRDSLEMALIGKALKLQLPIMGICRGHQMLNVYFGGSLIFDIPMDYDTTVKHRYPEYTPSEHKVTLLPGTLLAEIAGVTEGNVYSNHHQGIDDLADGLSGLGFSDDGLIESIQRSNFTKYPFLLGVQWHPEKMDYQNPLSGKIAERFVMEMKKFTKKP